MAYPGKGPRVGVLVRCKDQDREAIKARSAAAGLTVGEYLLELVHRDPVDPNGRPVWAADVDRGQQLELSA